jgi:hypothetical protein
MAIIKLKVILIANFIGAYQTPILLKTLTQASIKIEI